MSSATDNTIAQLPLETLAELGQRIVERAPDAGDLAPLSANELGAVATGDSQLRDAKEQIALVAWVEEHRDVIAGLYPFQAPPFDHLLSYWENFFRGPRGSDKVRDRSSSAISARLLDFDLGVPFGVPACAVTPHSGYIDHFASRGFDLLTYKTVRETAWNPHPSPNLGFASAITAPIGEADIAAAVEATLHPDALTAMRDASFVNSIGVPSLPAEQWMADIDRSRALLCRGQVLIVSVMGSPEELAPGEDGQLVDQFARVAAQAREAGANIIELNLSCPNTGGELICRDATLSGRILAHVRAAIGDTPIFIKISYLRDALLSSLVETCQHDMNGVVALNAVQVRAVDRLGKPFFKRRSNDLAGLSGVGIRDLGLATVHRLSALRGDEHPAPADWVIVGIGGVMSGDDYQAYRDAGADAVQSCTGAWLNPNLAHEIRSHALGEPEEPADRTNDEDIHDPDADWDGEANAHPWRRLLHTVNDAVRTGGLSLRVQEPRAPSGAQGADR